MLPSCGVPSSLYLLHHGKQDVSSTDRTGTSLGPQTTVLDVSRLQLCVRGRVMKFEGTGIVEGTENTPITGKPVGIAGVSTQ